MIVKIESGNRRIDAMELIRLSSALHVPVDFLLRPTPVVLSHRTSITAHDAGTEAEKESGRLDLALVAWLHDVQQMVELGVLQPEPPLEAETVVDAEAAARILPCGLDNSWARASSRSIRWWSFASELASTSWSLMFPEKAHRRSTAI